MPVAEAVLGNFFMGGDMAVNLSVLEDDESEIMRTIEPQRFLELVKEVESDVAFDAEVKRIFSGIEEITEEDLKFRVK